jgi:glutamate racemase
MIGVFDSGVGGLSVWKELYNVLPQEDYIYVADSANCPYGTKPLSFITQRAEAITRFLIKNGADVVVVACNTATAAAIDHLRSTFTIPFVGMEPAIKPAALTSETGVVGVLATANTFKGSLYHRTLARFATGVKVIERVGDGLVELVESGNTQGAEAEKLLHLYLDDMLKAGADAIVLGCTHYPFLEKTISKIVGPDVKIIDPAHAIAHQTEKIINSIPHENHSILNFYSTKSTDVLQKIASSIEPNLTENNFKIITI